MVSTISFIQANFQHNTAASRILSGTVVVKALMFCVSEKFWPSCVLFFLPKEVRTLILVAAWDITEGIQLP
jgi:hypothetical protein